MVIIVFVVGAVALAPEAQRNFEGGGIATIANEVTVDATGSLTVGGALNVPTLTTAGTTNLTGATGTIGTLSITGGTTTLAAPTITQVDATGGSPVSQRFAQG